MEGKVLNVDMDWRRKEELLAFIAAERIAVTIIGPEAPLVAGLADDINEAGYFCVGPGKAGARLEASKIFCKDFLRRHGIPTARGEAFDNYEDASAYVRAASFPCVVKFDGLAAGKGVTVAKDRAQAQQAIDDIYIGGKFGSTANRLLIEEFLPGDELSYIVFARGTDYIPFLSSQDHKARDEGDKGPNTGGMGAYTPVPWAGELEEKLCQDIIEPTLRGLAQDGIFYCGFLYAGLKIYAGRLRLLEYNCRLGDPEGEALLFSLQTDLAAFLLNTASSQQAKISFPRFEWSAQPSLVVVMAAGGYPAAYDTGYPIHGLGDVIHAAENTKVFHCGTRYEDDQWVTAGGRVLAVTARGNDYAHAKERAYRLTRRIRWHESWFRRDIGNRV